MICYLVFWNDCRRLRPDHLLLVAGIVYDPGVYQCSPLCWSNRKRGSPRRGRDYGGGSATPGPPKHAGGGAHERLGPRERGERRAYVPRPSPLPACPFARSPPPPPRAFSARSSSRSDLASLAYSSSRRIASFSRRSRGGEVTHQTLAVLPAWTQIGVLFRRGLFH